MQTEVELVDYPPAGLVAPDEVFPLNAAWVPHRWYRGWTKSILPAVRFDAKPTEFTLAKLFESSTPDVSWWLRIEAQQGIWVPWGNQRRHYPDFVVITSDGDHWLVEGKADDRANDPEVRAKKDAALEWARFVNDSGDAPDPWGTTSSRPRRRSGGRAGPGAASRTSGSGSRRVHIGCCHIVLLMIVHGSTTDRGLRVRPR